MGAGTCVLWSRADDCGPYHDEYVTINPISDRLQWQTIYLIFPCAMLLQLICSGNYGVVFTIFRTTSK